MTITLVQKNGANAIGTVSCTVPAWGSTTTAGNLLLVVVSDATQANTAWTAVPAGYTEVFSTNGFQFDTNGFSRYGLFWKIAAGSDATPGVCTCSTTSSWSAYTYEFSATDGWATSAFDTEAHSAGAGTLVTTLASGSTATLAQANELAVAVYAGDGTNSALTFTNGYTNAIPTTNNTRLWLGWQETAATTAQSTTASWTTSRRPGVRVATFMTGAAAPITPRVMSAVGVGT